jgi:hypothetical protein
MGSSELAAATALRNLAFATTSIARPTPSKTVSTRAVLAPECRFSRRDSRSTDTPAEGRRIINAQAACAALLWMSFVVPLQITEAVPQRQHVIRTPEEDQWQFRFQSAT